MSLRERREVVALSRSEGSGSGALISLVGVAGSSYRRPGARLLALLDGRTAGTLSGGCLEADLLRRAAWKSRAGAVVEHFSTAFDDTSEIPYGLGCGGEVDLLTEPLGSPEAIALTDALNATLQGETRTVATLLPGADQPLARIVIDAPGDVLFATEALPTDWIVDLRRAALDSRDATALLTTPFGLLFTERLQPVQRLVIFGAGEDARPLARLAAEMGWAVVVADGRVQHARAERFETADHVVVTTSAVGVPVLASDAVVLMTHSYEADRRLLAELLPLAPRYMGLLGARHRSALLLHEASGMAGISLETATQRTHAPIGLELGGDGPEAVALAVMAELQHALFGRYSVAPARRMDLAEVERQLATGPAQVVRVESCAMYADVELTDLEDAIGVAR